LFIRVFIEKKENTEKEHDEAGYNFQQCELLQRLMAMLFDTSSDNIGLHLKNIFNDSELSENSVTEVFSVTASDGKNYGRLGKTFGLDFAGKRIELRPR
jgi:hypothetical protein